MARNLPDGFTLIELLIALAIAGILAALVYPSYQHAIRKARRAEGRTALQQLMLQQERYFSQHTSYIAFSSSSSDEDASRFKWFSGETPQSSAYEISAAACDGGTLQDCVILTAVPGTAKVNPAFRDSICGSLSLANTGIKSPVKPECW